MQEDKAALTPKSHGKSGAGGGKPLLDASAASDKSLTYKKMPAAAPAAGDHQPAAKPVRGESQETATEALKRINDSLAQDLNNEALHIQKCQLLKKAGDRKALTKALEDAVGIFKYNVFFIERLADVYQERGNHLETLKWRRKLAEIKPDDPYVIKRLALAAIRCGELSYAEKAYDKLLQLKEADPDPLGHTFFQEMYKAESAGAAKSAVHQLGLKIVATALKTRPDSIPLLEGAARLASYTVSLEAAQNYYEKLLSLKSEPAARRQWKTELLRVYAKTGLPVKWKKLNQDLIEDYRAHLSREPNDSRSWIQLAHQLTQSGLAQDALDAYHQSIRADSNNLQAIYELGKLLVRMNRSEDAIKYYLDILSPGSGEAVNKSFQRALGLSLADLYFKLGRYQEAMDIYAQDEETNARFIAQLLEVGGKLESAANYYDLAIDKLPRDGRTYLAKAEFCIRREAWNEAVDYAHKGLACPYNNKETLEALYVCLAMGQMKLKRLKDAMTTINTAVETYPDHDGMAFRKVKLLYLAGKKDEGKKVAEKLEGMLRTKIECAPTASNLWALLGDCCLILNKTDAAQEAYLNALNHDAMDAEAVRGLGIISEMKSEFALTVEYFQRAIVLDPLNLATPVLREKIAKLERQSR